MESIARFLALAVMVFSVPISIYAVESKLGPNLPFFESKLVQVFFFFLFVIQNSSFCAENEIKKTRITIFEAKLGPIMLRNMLGPSLDSTLDQVLTRPWAKF